jgi:hypothetical protein
MGAQRIFVIHPGEDDDSGFATMAEEQIEILSPEFCPKPVFPAFPERTALAIDRRCWIGRNGLENQLR